MNKAVSLAVILAFACAPAFAAPKVLKSPASAKASTTASANPDTATVKVTKVYAAEDRGSKFRAYVIEWKGQEAVIIATPAIAEKKAGDTITVMAQRMGDTLNFMVMEPSPAMPQGAGPAGGIPPMGVNK